MIVRSVSDHAEFTRHLSFVVTTTYLYLYLQYESHPYTPWLFYIMYMAIWEFLLYRKLYNNPSWSRISYLVTGIGLVVFNVGALEAIGHGLFEHHHSYVLEFFNVSPSYYLNVMEFVQHGLILFPYKCTVGKHRVFFIHHCTASILS